MSEEQSEPKPLKLKLPNRGESSPADADGAQQPEPPRSAQLRVRSRAERQASEPDPEPAPVKPEPVIEPSFAAAEPEPIEEPVPERPRPVLKRRPDPEPIEEISPGAADEPLAAEEPFTPEPEPIFEPEPEPFLEPFLDPQSADIPDGEPEHAPPPLPKVSHAAPATTLAVETPETEQEEADPLEAAAERVAGKDGHGHSPWLSIIMIIALLAILGGSGYGLWYLLAGSGTPEEAAAETAPVEEAPSLNPIEQAKKAIASRPTEELRAVVGDDVAAGAATPAAPAPTPPLPPTVNGEHVDAVKAYLASVHVGGMRKTPPAMVIINGESFIAGAVVEPATGLQFSGIHNGKLAFTDKNGVVYLKSF